MALVAPILEAHDRLRAAGINGPDVARFLGSTGQRRLAARAVEPTP